MSLSEVFIPRNLAEKVEGSLVRPDIFRYADPSDHHVRRIGSAALHEEVANEPAPEVKLPVSSAEAA
jgi:hypothetical protein